MYKRILVAYDGSALSQQAMEEMKMLTRHLPQIEEVHIISVIEPTGPATNKLMIDSITNEISEDMKQQLAQIKSDLQAIHPAVFTKVFTARAQDNPGKLICKYAVENEISMIIAGSRGLGNVKGTFLGSVSSKIVKEATCPVLVIK